MKKILVYLLSICLMAGVLSGCGGKSDKPNSNSNKNALFDSMNHEIAVTEPKRVVALMGSFAEIWTLAGGELVGVTDDAYEERGMKLPKEVETVGKFNSPNMEKIIELNPDFVILSSETQEHGALKPALESAGIPYAYFNVTYFEDYLSMLKTCTQITGREDLYEKNGEEVEKRIKSIISEVNKKDAPSILFIITYSGGAIAKGSDCMTGMMLKELGTKNIVDSTPSLLKEFSVESIIEQDPDYIFAVAMGNDDEIALKSLNESLESNPAWGSLTAVKNNQYVLLPKDMFLYKPNARWGESYEYLFDILYGEQ